MNIEELIEKAKNYKPTQNEIQEMLKRSRDFDTKLEAETQEQIRSSQEFLNRIYSL